MHISDETSPKIGVVIGSSRPHMRPTERNIELKTDEAMLTGDGTFYKIDAAFAEHLAEVAALATELCDLTGRGLPLLKEPS